MTREIKILAFIRHFPPPNDGGEYYYNYHLFKKLRQLGCEITILSHLKASTQLIEGIEIIPLGTIKTGRFVYTNKIARIKDFIVNVWTIRQYLSKGKYDFVFSGAGYKGNLTVFLANITKRVPVVGINLAEEIMVLQQTTKIRAWLQRVLLKSHTINIGISEYTRNLLLRCGIEKSIVTIYPFIENKPSRDKTTDRQFLIDTFGLDKNRMIVGFLGRHIPRKGLLNLIGAVEKLLHEDKKITLLIAGLGTDTNRIKQRIRQSSFLSQIKMVGVLKGEEKDYFFNGIDVFAMPNYEDPISGDTEGFGIVFIEAAQYSTPVIGGNSGGVKEAISHDFNGFLVNGQDKNSIADAILRYYQNPSLRKIHGHNGKEWAKNFIKADPLSQLLIVLQGNIKSKR